MQQRLSYNQKQMNIRGITTLILSLLIIITITLSLYAPQLADFVLPRLVNSQALQIEVLETAAISWRGTHIARLKGSIATDSGRLHLDVEDLTIDYQALQPRLLRVLVTSAEIELDASDKRNSDETGGGYLFLPPEIVVERLRLFAGGGLGSFEGRFQLTGADDGFKALAVDENSHAEITGDAGLSKFEVVLAQSTTADRIGIFHIDISEKETTAVEADMDLAMLLSWLRKTKLLPDEYQALLGDIESVDGNLHAAGHIGNSRQWRGRVELGLRRLQTADFYGGAMLKGELITSADTLQFNCTETSLVRLHVPGYGLDQISSVEATLPVGYTFAQSMSEKSILTARGTANIALHQTDDTDLSADLTHWTLEEGQLAEVEFSNIKLLSPYAASAASVTSKFSLVHASPLIIDGDVSSNGIRTVDWPKDLPPLALRAGWSWNDGTFTISGIADWNDAQAAKWSVESHENSGALNIEFDKPIDQLSTLLKRFTSARKRNIELTAGRAKGQFNWAWDDKHYDNRAVLLASGIHGSFLGLEFDDVSAELNSSDLLGMSFTFSSSIPSLKLANDVNATDINLVGRWQDGLYVDRATLSILGGSIKLTPSYFDLGLDSHDIELEVSDVDFGKVLAMLEQEGLTGTGRLSGVIPLRLSDAGTIVADGYLKNTTKGAINYKPNGGESPQLDNIAMQALQDFRYDTLDINLNYQLSGDYVIRARLEGRNPQLYDGYPIAFNINLSGTLPGILRASLITGDFHSEILREIQQKQN